MTKAKILVLDEATSNIDYETDTVIQSTLKRVFAKSTVIVVAHRIASIIDADKIIVLEQGKVVEDDHPYNLLVN